MERLGVHGPARLDKPGPGVGENVMLDANLGVVKRLLFNLVNNLALFDGSISATDDLVDSCDLFECCKPLAGLLTHREAGYFETTYCR